ncbi:MAG TPA: isochorismate synthase [Chroococcidiopsis sp.]
MPQPSSNPYFFCSFTFFDQPSALSPFPAATVFLPRWQIVRRQDRCNAIANLVISSHLNIENVATELWQGLQTIRSARHGLLSDSIRQPFQQWKTTEIHNFKASVVSALQSIYANQLSKVVLAHEVDVLSPVAFRWLHSLHNLRQRHPDCYIFSTSNGKGQSFIGASPERLISIRDRTLITDALAGSAPRGKTVEEDIKLGDRLLSSDKERHEHRVVVDFMIHQLQQFGLSPRWAAIPTLRRLSNIQHLHTPIQATVLPNLHPLQILAELHPTPAVAGMSRDLACQYIRRHEPFERSLYAAPLGWVDAQGNAEFIVGIRSALLEGHRARLYAGAGIVAGSNPDRELAEVKLKLQALLQSLV